MFVNGDQSVTNQMKYEVLKHHIPNMILHEISNVNSKKYYKDDYEDDLKMLQEMDVMF